MIAALLPLALLSPGVRAADAPPTVDQIIAQARSVLGTEDKLNGLQTLVLSGEILDDKQQPIASATLMFKKPRSQRTELSTPDHYFDVTATDGVQGWREATDKDGHKRLAILGPPDLDTFIYTGMENLYFYRATQHVLGAEVTSDGEADFHGVKCWKVHFQYPDSIDFIRYFDTTTGDLRGSSIPSQGTEVIESGKTTEAGITFAAAVTNIDKDGKAQTFKITKIEVNQPLDDKLFDVPLPTELLSSPAPDNSAAPAAAPVAAPAATPAAAPVASPAETTTPAAPPADSLPPLSLPDLAPSSSSKSN
jgi:hypothetical protein